MSSFYQRKFLKGLSVFFLLTIFTFSIQAQTTETKGKNPIIIIPGLTGSELVNSQTKETVWFKPQRAKDDDLRLPISSLNVAKNKDSLVPGDLIRNVKLLKFLPEIEIYQKLIDALQTRGGYTEGKWDNPTVKGYEDTFYVFAYDWRLDNVENAQLLMRKIETLKRTLKRPNLKFNIVAHSMGGLIARYAAMYGSADLPAGKPRPTWAGAKNFSKVFLLGTPNEGSPQSLDALINGFSYVGGGLNLIGNLVGQFVDGNRSVDGAAAVSATLGGVVGGPFGTILGGASTFTGKLGTEAVGALFSTSTDLSLSRFLKPPELSCPK